MTKWLSLPKDTRANAINESDNDSVLEGNLYWYYQPIISFSKEKATNYGKEVLWERKLARRCPDYKLMSLAQGS